MTKKATIKFSSPLTWVGGKLFDGFLLTGLILPTGFTAMRLGDENFNFAIPQWTLIPISQGNVKEISLFTSDSFAVDCNYTYYILNKGKQRVSTGAGPSITLVEGSNEITVAPIAVPTAGTTPQPQ